MIMIADRKMVSVHSLVAHAFIGPRPPGLQINHIDADRTNNHFSNLEYVTGSENMQHAVKHGLVTSLLKEGHDSRRNQNRCLNCGKMLKKDAICCESGPRITEKDIPVIRQLRSEGNKLKSIGEMYGVTEQTIFKIIKGITWRHVRDD